MNTAEAKRVERIMTPFKLVWAFGIAPEVLVLVSELEVEVEDFFLSVDDAVEVSFEVGYEVAVAVALVDP